MASQRSRILVVDDDPAVLSLLGAMLGEVYEVLLAEDPNAALAIEQPLDAIICDQRMPDMNGVELLALFRQRDATMVRILLTGYEDLDAAIDAVNLGAIHHYLNKPVRRHELFEVLERLLEEHVQQQHQQRLAQRHEVLDEVLGEMDHKAPSLR